MERLKDSHFELGSLEAEASSLLRGAEPYSVPPSLKRNVRVRLVEAAPRRRVPLLFRVTRVTRVAIAFGILGVVAVAVAAVDRAWHRAPTPALQQAAVSAPLSSTPSAASTSSTSPIAQAPSARLSLSSASVEPRSDAHHGVAHEPAPMTEASLVYGAAHALRNEGDPAHAARVLDDYFKRYPHGALAEEAQALTIDVAVARGDARAKGLASRYLAAYPLGHFRSKAERVLAAQ